MIPFLTQRNEIPYFEALQPRENSRGPAGSEAVRVCLVDWSTYDAFCEDVLPDVSTVPDPGDPGYVKLRRKLPEAHPRKPHLFAAEAELMEGVGFADRDGLGPMRVSANSPTINDGLARVAVTYRPITYSLATDAVVDAAGNAIEREMLRYITRTYGIASEATQIGGRAFVFAGTSPPAAAPGHPVGQEAPVAVLPLIEMRLQWHMVPGIPPGALSYTIPTDLNTTRYTSGRINDRPFDFRSLFGNPFGRGIVLFMGIDVGEPYFTVSGTRVWDHIFNFTIRPPLGWNFLYRRGQTDATRGFYEVSSDGQFYHAQEPNTTAFDGRRPYNSVNLAAQLFRLSAP